jgi:Gametolysin peptidase M11
MTRLHSTLLASLVSLPVLCAAQTASAAVSPVVKGTLVELHGHTLNGQRVESGFAIVTAEDELALDDPQPAALVGQRVELADADPNSPGLQGRVRAIGRAHVVAAPEPGPRSLLAIIVKTPDAPQPAATESEARTAIFTGSASTNAFYRQQSEGATSFVGRLREDGDVAGPLFVDVSTSGCDFEAIAGAAEDAASAAGWSPDAYDHVLYVLPRIQACHWGGLGNLPGRHAWVNGTLAVRVVAHELGHNLGAHHANGLRCYAGGSPTAIGGECASSEYEDPFDVMGLNGVLMSSWHRAQVGELPAGQRVELRKSASVALTSSSVFATVGPRLLLIPRKQAHHPVDSWLAVELRSHLDPFDVFGAGAPVTTGITVREVPSMLRTDQSQLLDNHPETPSWADAPLQPGETFRDGEYGITIGVDPVASGIAQVHVSMPDYIDDVAPQAPEIYSSAGDSRGADLHWTASSDDESVDHYEVERSGTVVASTPELQFKDDRVAELAEASYRVIAVDPTGNRGASEAVTVNLADVTAPGEVPGFQAQVRGQTVSLSWGPAADNRGVNSYVVTRDGTRVSSRPATSFDDQAPAGQHQYVVRAKDQAGNLGPGASLSVTVASGGGSGGGGSGGGSSGGGSGGGSTGGGKGGGGTVHGGTRPANVRMTSWQRGARRTIVMRFRSARATAMYVRVQGRIVRRSHTSRISVRLRVPRGSSRRVIVVARNKAGRTHGGWTVR